jgi:hypothetical protein
MMKMPFLHFRQLSITSRLLLLIAVLMLISSLVLASSLLSRRPETQPHVADTSPTPPYAAGTNHLIFGANLDRQISTSPHAQILAKQLGLRTIRLGDNSNGQLLAEFYSKVQTIKDMGLVPLIILHGGAIADPEQRRTLDIDMVNKIQQIFGGPDAEVHYELGNENDLNPGMSAKAYTAMWNTLLPTLKPLAPHSWFGGPVNFQQNPTYISYFVHNAHPRPDFISWHEYTCGREAPASHCIKHIDNWTTHVNNTRNAITVNSDPVPPIMISEWNYSPAGIAGDGKSSDPLFLEQWTARALQTLAANNIFASYHFNVEEILGLIDNNNNPTVQGQAFHIAHELLIGKRAYSMEKFS